MIDIIQELESYSPINLDSLSEKAVGIPDNIRNSIILYNKALDSIRAGSEDMAIIELKKAVSMNPDFCEAMNLLGICYSYIHDQDRAAEMFQRVIRTEGNSIKAMHYMEMLKSGEGADQRSGKGRKRQKWLEKPQGNTPSLLTGLRASFKIDWIKYVIGFAAGALILFFIMLPLTGGSDVSTSQPLPDRPSVSDADRDTGKESQPVQDEEKEKLKAELAAANTQLEYYTMAMKLFEINQLVSEGKTMEAADGLLLFASTELHGPEKNLLDELRESVMPRAAKQAYNEGKKLYDAKNYSAAAEKLEKVTRYWPSSDKADKALYFLGRCYIEMKESRKALEAFEKLVNDFPNSTYAKQYAPSWIESLKGQP